MGTAQSHMASLEHISCNRKELWPKLLGADRVQRSKPPGYFAALCNLHPLSEKVQHDFCRITKDTPRVCTNESMQAELRLVLRAYAVHMPSIGYLPSLAYLAMSLLFGLLNPETTFWCLVSLVEDRRLFAGSVFGCPDFVEVDVFNSLVTHHLPRVAHYLEAGTFFAGHHGLMMIGSAEWLGLLFAKSGAVGGSFHLSHACLDTLCMFGLDAVHLIGLEVVRRAERQLLQAQELEDMIAAARAVEGEITRCKEGARSALASAFGFKYRGSVAARLHDVAACRRRIQQEQVHPDPPPLRTGHPVAALAIEHRQWSPELHALCSELQRAAVRAVLMLHARDDCLLAAVPIDVLLRRILAKVPVEG